MAISTEVLPLIPTISSTIENADRFIQLTREGQSVPIQEHMDLYAGRVDIVEGLSQSNIDPYLIEQAKDAIKVSNDVRSRVRFSIVSRVANEIVPPHQPVPQKFFEALKKQELPPFNRYILAQMICSSLFMVDSMNASKVRPFTVRMILNRRDILESMKDRFFELYGFKDPHSREIRNYPAFATNSLITSMASLAKGTFDEAVQVGKETNTNSKQSIRWAI